MCLQVNPARYGVDELGCRTGVNVNGRDVSLSYAYRTVCCENRFVPAGRIRQACSLKIPNTVPRRQIGERRGKQRAYPAEYTFSVINDSEFDMLSAVTILSQCYSTKR